MQVQCTISKSTVIFEQPHDNSHLLAAAWIRDGVEMGGGGGNWAVAPGIGSENKYLQTPVSGSVVASNQGVPWELVQGIHKSLHATVFCAPQFEDH